MTDVMAQNPAHDPLSGPRKKLLITIRLSLLPRYFKMEAAVKYAWLFVEQIALMSLKHISQKQRNGRQWWKDTIMIQLFLLLYVSI
jgi:hypothetical protein